MANTKDKTQKREVRRNRIRSRVIGTSLVPRLAVFKSNRYLYAQVIDDSNGKTLVSITSLKKGSKKQMSASEVGNAVAEALVAKGIKKVVFDRGGFIYTGRVKELADGARAAGLVF